MLDGKRKRSPGSSNGPVRDEGDHESCGSTDSRVPSGSGPTLEAVNISGDWVSGNLSLVVAESCVPCRSYRMQ